MRPHSRHRRLCTCAMSVPLPGGRSHLASTRSRAPRAEEPLFGCSSVRHWHLAPGLSVGNWLPRRQRACPSAALDERVLGLDGSGRGPTLPVAMAPAPDVEALADRKARMGVAVSVCLPARDEAATIGADRRRGAGRARRGGPRRRGRGPRRRVPGRHRRGGPGGRRAGPRGRRRAPRARRRRGQGQRALEVAVRGDRGPRVLPRRRRPQLRGAFRHPAARAAARGPDGRVREGPLRAAARTAAPAAAGGSPS